MQCSTCAWCSACCSCVLRVPHACAARCSARHALCACVSCVRACVRARLTPIIAEKCHIFLHLSPITVFKRILWFVCDLYLISQQHHITKIIFFFSASIWIVSTSLRWRSLIHVCENVILYYFTFPHWFVSEYYIIFKLVFSNGLINLRNFNRNILTTITYYVLQNQNMAQLSTPNNNNYAPSAPPPYAPHETVDDVASPVIGYVARS